MAETPDIDAVVFSGRGACGPWLEIPSALVVSAYSLSRCTQTRAACYAVIPLSARKPSTRPKHCSGSSSCRRWLVSGTNA